jgi:hypothetical protein
LSRKRVEYDAFIPKDTSSLPHVSVQIRVDEALNAKFRMFAADLTEKENGEMMPTLGQG